MPTGEIKTASCQSSVIIGLLDSMRERLEFLEAKEDKDDFVNGQIYEITVAIIHIQTAYLKNCL
jgi:hypothetical protein